MLSEEIIQQQIKFTLKETQFKGLGKRYAGKARDVYVADDQVFLIAVDRQSAFDRNIAYIPFKGQVLTQTSAFWFEKTRDIIAHHLLAVPDPNVVVCRRLTVFPVEVVVRGYITGVTDTAVWTAYQRGERSFCGNILPDGLSKNQKFDHPIITPTTKSDDHDQAISAREIIKRRLMTQEQWLYVDDKALQLFARGTQIAQDHGLILVDTKYEFGYDREGRIYLIDEIHTTDSSRYWLKASYEERFAGNQEPESIDKEFLRLWFVEHCDPYHDKVLPDAPQELVVEVSRRYIQLYQMITGQNFQGEAGDVSERIRRHLKDYGCH